MSAAEMTTTRFEWPTPRLEEWRYTNLSPIASIEWRDDERSLSDYDTNATLAGRASVELLFVNGRFVKQSGELPYVSASRIGVPIGGSAPPQPHTMPPGRGP